MVLWRLDEGKHTSELRRDDRPMRLRRDVPNALNEGGDPPGNLFKMSSFLYRQTKTRRYRRPCRTIPKKIQEDFLRHSALTLKHTKHLVFTTTSWALSSSDDEILVGGQAVIEGVMMRSPKGYSVAVRRQDGTVRTMKDPLLALGQKWKIFKAPVLRGVGVLGQALVLGIRALRFSADEALTEEAAKPETKNTQKDTPQVSSWLIAGSLVIGVGFNLLLIVVL